MVKKIKYVIILTSLMSSTFIHFHTTLAGYSLNETINHLLTFIAESNCIFIRNDKEYNSQDAAEHLKNKYIHFKKEINTPEDFIELCATKSLLSGKPYFVQCGPNTKMLTAEWLKNELIKYQGTSQVNGKSD